MKRLWSSKSLFFGMIAVLLIPYLVYAASSAGAGVSIWSEVNGASSAHWWSTDDPNYLRTWYSLDAWDITNGEPGDRVAATSDDSGATWGNANLSINWNPVQGHTYKAVAYTQVVNQWLQTLAEATDDDVATK